MSQEGSMMWNTDCHLNKIAEEGSKIKRAMTKKNEGHEKVQVQLSDEDKAFYSNWMLT